MTIGELLGIIGLSVFAIYKQTQRHRIEGASRFKLAVVYGVIGLVVGGFNLPHTALGVVFLLASLALSLVVGWIRGRYTRMWVEDGAAWTQGTALTVGLFIGLVVVKFGLGALAYALDVADDGGVGEVLLMIALMVAVQAELVWRRALRLLAATPPAPVATPADPRG